MNAKYIAVITLLAASLVGAVQTQAGTVNPGNPLGNNTTNNLGMYSGLIRIKTAVYNIEGQSFVDNTNVTVPPVFGTMKFSVADTNNPAGAGKVSLTSSGRLTGDVVDAVVNINGTNPGTISATYGATNSESARITNNAELPLPGVYLIALEGGFNATLTQSGKRGPQTFVSSSNDADANSAVGAVYSPTSGDGGYIVDMSTNASVSGRRIRN
jgi:hypothetical protein